MARREYHCSNKHLFVNPYNFVPVNLTYTDRSDTTRKEKSLLTGHLSCSLKCRTPLAIPNVSEKIETEAAEHYRYPFIGADQGAPRIPGSAIRGVIRNVYETITNSCFGTMKEDTVITARSGEPFNPGLLVMEENVWKLYKAVRYKLPVRCCQKYTVADSGTPVKYEVQDAKAGTASIVESGKGKTGYLCIGEKIGEKTQNRRWHGVFEKKTLVEQYPVLNQTDFQKLESILQVYRDETINKKFPKEHSGYPGYEKAKARGIIPVYYMIQSGRAYISFAALGRKAYYKTLNEAAGAKAHQQCRGRNKLCPACALFGTIEGEGLGSRVRFTDAVCTDLTQDRIKRNVVFKELGSPRISYSPFYMREIRKGANYREGYDSDLLQLRGRKFYWHHIPELDLEGIERNKRNGSFDVFMPREDESTDPDFSFRIYFDGVSEEQLKLLSAAIHLYENDLNGKQCHKMGHGKPLGYGSVKMMITNCVIRSFDVDNGWEEMPYAIEELCGARCYQCDEKTLGALMRITKFGFIKEKVEYPGIVTEGFNSAEAEKLKENDNDTANHKWFTKNYALSGKPKPPDQPFPEIMDDIKKLKMAKYELWGQNYSGQKAQAKETAGGRSDNRYRAIITSNGKKGNNKDLMNYDIQIKDNKQFRNSRCKMSAHKSLSFQIGQEVEVTLFMGSVFNYADPMKKGE